MAKAYFNLYRKFKSLPNFDVLVVGYPGQLDVFFAKFLTLFRRKPIIWDVFMSIYLVSKERELHKKNSFSVKLLKFIEYVALRIPNKLIIDTKQYANWFNKTYKIPNEKFCLIPTGADDDIFFLEKFIEYKPKDKFTVLYYGTYISNHGVPYMIEAANSLKNNPSIIFKFIGNGPEYDICLKLIQKYNLNNIILYPWMDQNELKRFMLEADVVLGAFGKTPQSLMTIQNKIYESMAMGKIVVTGESKAIKDVFDNYKELIYCDRDNAHDLCSKLINLYENTEVIEKISQNAYLKFSNQFSIKHNGKLFSECFFTKLDKG